MNLLRIGMVFTAVLPLTAQVPTPFAAGIHVTVKEGDGALNNIKASRAWEPVVIVSDNDGRPIGTKAIRGFCYLSIKCPVLSNLNGVSPRLAPEE